MYLPRLEFGTIRSAESAPAITVHLALGTVAWAVVIALVQLNHL
jgi:hypothetical protein